MKNTNCTIYNAFIISGKVGGKAVKIQIVNSYIEGYFWVKGLIKVSVTMEV